MWKQKRKQSKAKEMVSQIRRFISGEDISQELIQQNEIEPIEGGFVLVMHNEDGKVEINGKIYTEDEWQQKVKQLNEKAILWHEQKTYIHMKPAPNCKPLSTIRE